MILGNSVHASYVSRLRDSFRIRANNPALAKLQFRTESISARLVLAWAFDVTPTGIQATPALSTANGAATTHLRRNVSFVDGIS